MSKQASEQQSASLQSSSGCVSLQPLPEMKTGKDTAGDDCSSGEVKKHKTANSSVEKTVFSTSRALSGVAVRGSPGMDRSPKKQVKQIATNNREETKITVTESLPEVKAKTTGKGKGRVVPSRYKESAKNRALATPTKMSDSSCISINQSKLFSTATSSTPVSAGGGKVHDVSVRPKPPPKMAPLDTTARQRGLSAATASATGKDKPCFKIKKSDKAATVKVKPLRVEAPAKTQKGAEKERVSEHRLLYNQYLQWSYLCRLSEASIRSERPQLSHQAQQLSGLVDTARYNCADLERKLQAVKLYREMAQLEHQLNGLLSTVNECASAVRADLSLLATTLDATRSRLQLSGCHESADSTTFLGDLMVAAHQCLESLSSLDGTVSPHANLLQHTAQAVASLQCALTDSCRAMTSSSEMLQELSSLALQEASLALGTGAAVHGPGVPQAMI